MTLLLIQMTVVLLATLAGGWLASRLGQSRVIGEIVAGICLGPSVFGALAPHLFAQTFPASFLPPFDILSNVGLVLFLFLIGVELDFAQVRNKSASASLVSAVSIALPFVLAAAFAHSIRVRFAPAHAGSLPFVLLLGVSLSITAFPVLARIIEERGLGSTPIGTTALVCAAFDDVTAWTLLATALTLLPHASDSETLGRRVLYIAIYVALMLFVVRPTCAVFTRKLRHKPLNYEIFGLIIPLLLLSAAATNWLGIHPLFGAFIAGTCFPRIPEWQHAVRGRFEMLVFALLLPFFFALTGMRTQLGLLHGLNVWGWTLFLLLIAVVGKLGGATLTARATGESWHDALALGALLNTRGLVELVVLNVAYNAHVFSPTLFTMLVVMALVTTMMTTPLLNRLTISGVSSRKAERRQLERVA